MAKTKLKKQKQKLAKKSNTASTPTTPTPKLVKKLSKLNNKKKKLSKVKSKLRPKPDQSDSEPESDPQTKLHNLLAPFTKDQLITLFTDLGPAHNSLFTLAKSAADTDISHRKIFMHGLAWDATRHLLESALAQFGEIEDLNVVTDRTTGKCKGYAFFTFKTGKSARKLLKNPKLLIGNRFATCQLAAAGPTAPGAATPSTTTTTVMISSSSDFADRKIYIKNVPVNVSPEKLRLFFAKFGEIENGPTGLDPNTGKFKGYAIFVYRTVEGAKKCLEEPYKLFEGQQLHCSKAAEGKGKVAGVASITTAMQPVQPEVMAAMQQQQAALIGQRAGFMNANPFYGGAAGLMGNVNLGGLMGGYYGMMGGQLPGLGLGFGGSGVGAQSGGAVMQGLQHLYPSGQSGQGSSSLAKTGGSGYSSYL